MSAAFLSAWTAQICNQYSKDDQNDKCTKQTTDMEEECRQNDGKPKKKKEKKKKKKKQPVYIEYTIPQTASKAHCTDGTYNMLMLSLLSNKTEHF